ncbi:DUF393 domain-containing protein [Undibacterium sp. RTI2.1]|uniref:thiol-disulfide oxidoreductase DCC family protein n=1 Tax=unclassified Undibacterium TaxID=2630295 RepID=UPI002AB36E76|nr:MULTISPECIES: DUF393 domain-containing protein [unclassified Undibacterium]MDY7538459.1 DUF393 domain-containing protein [Undibacterium sp. 5I1]MEB0030014.1 DUF393 domain-containing protein [Undibacterium sp. RTI2.1]MEB0114917.1 DUF393 domain-containing protein [Undibacterium sp. RTI2.2]MEB0230639.1 DUF393 domain-containing protein [Undibacterium sp. 10I3]MEB0255876.1 DUF393 domain-containing protein [Undibacterium sp. 5I1]
MQTLTIFYDGACPLCLAEIVLLRSKNQRDLLRFVDIADQHYQSDRYQISCEQAMAQIHGRLEGDGKDTVTLIGVDVFAAAYQRTDLKLLAWIYTRPWLRPILVLSYRFFAKYRHTISRLFGPAMLSWAKKRTQTKVTD